MAVIPTPVIAAVPPFAYTETDQDISLDGTASVKSDAGTAISTWSWSIFHYPEGTTPVNCYLTGANTDSPTLRYPGGFPGTVGVILSITDDNADPTLDESYPNIYPTQNGASANYGKGAYAVVGPVKTQVIFVSMLTTEGLLLPAVGHRAWFPEVGGYWDLVKKVTTVSAALNNVASVKLQRARFVSSVDGDTDADGSIAKPFNPASAAANTNPFTGLPFVGPLAQAQVALIDIVDMAEDPSQGYTVIVHGGTYNENININASSAKVPWHYIFLDDTQFTNGNTFAYAAAAVADQLAAPNLRITCHGTVSNFAHGGFALSNTDSTWVLDIDGDLRVAGNVSVSGSFAAGPTAQLDGPTFAGTFNVPNLRLLEVDSTTFSGALTCRDIFEAYNSIFASITVSNAPTDARSGFFNCGWSASPVFTGPGGSALFDPITRHRFAAASGAYAGGATVADVLFVGALHSNEAQFAIRAENGDLGLTANVNVIIDGNTGYVTIDSAGLTSITAGNELSLTATTGSLYATALAGDAYVTAYEGELWLEAYGSGRGAYINTEYGDITLWAGAGAEEVSGPHNVNITAALGEVNITAQGALNGDINLTAVRNTTLSSTGLTTIGTTGVNKTLTLQTTDGHITLAAAGTAREVQVSTVNGDIEVEAGGTNRALRLSTTDGQVEITANGATNGTVRLVADDNITAEAAAGMIDLWSGDVAQYSEILVDNGYTLIEARDNSSPASTGDIDLLAENEIYIYGQQLVLIDSHLRTRAGAFANGSYGVVVTGAQVKVAPALRKDTLTGVVFTNDATKVKGTMFVDHGLETGAWITINGTTNGNGTFVVERINALQFYLKNALDSSYYIAWADWSGADNTGDVVIGPFYLDAETAYLKSAGTMMVQSTAGDLALGVVSGDGDAYLSNDGTGSVVIRTDAGDVTLDPGGAGVVYIDSEAYVFGALASEAGGATTTRRVMNALGMSGEVSVVTTTSLTTVYSKSLGAGFFTGTHGQTIKGSAHFSFAAGTDSKLIYGVMSSTALFSCGGGINGKDGHLEFEIWFTDQADPNDYGWWYRLSTYTKGSKAAVTLEEDSGFGTFVDTGAIDFELMVDISEANDMTFNGCRIWSITE